jgi:hypothetical protein
MRAATAFEQRRFGHLRWRLALLCFCLTAAALVGSATAGAAAAAPALRVSAQIPDHVTPSEFPPDKLFFTWVSVLNTGTEPLSGELTVKYTLPSGINFEFVEDLSGGVSPVCNTVGQVTECTADATGVPPSRQLLFRAVNSVASDATGGPGAIEVSGGGSSEVFTYPFSMSVEPPGPFAIKTFDVAPADGPVVAATRAGSDPAELATTVELFSEARMNYDIPNPNVLTNAATESFRDTIVHVPPGFVGNPTATPARCDQSQLTTMIGITGIPQCPPDSQVGLVQLKDSLIPLYNVEPPQGSAAAFGFMYANIIITLRAKVRPSDNGIDVVSLRAPNSIPIPKYEVMFWGNPTDPSHDRLRGVCLTGFMGYNPAQGDCSLKTRSDVPFLRTPTSCPGTPLPWSIEMDTYEHPGTFVGKATTTPAMTGCEANPFDPDLSLAPSDRSAGTPSGLEVAISIKQDASIDGIAPADLRQADLTLPRGVTLNPASADGLEACTDAQLRLGLEGPSSCPDASKLGSLELQTPLLEEPIGGSVYLRSQASQDPASGELYRLAIELESDRFGIHIKLPGSLKVDPDSGQLTTSFSDLPQLPFESVRLHLKTGPRAPLTTPAACGTYSGHAVLHGWNGAVQSIDPSFSIDQGCSAPGFDPSMEAGVEDNTAGDFSPFSLTVTRDARQPNLARIDATLPEGELAKLAGVTVCSDAQATAGVCPASSRIGQLVAGIGEGTSPLYLPQPGKAPTAVYLAGPYKGAPYSVLTEVPAQAGPFDLGEVLVRSALRIHPETVQATVASDPLPQIFKGVPVSYRDVRIQIDRPRFTLNPTDCSPTKVTGTLASIAGDSARVSDRFQVADCGALGFKPRLSLRLKGKTRRGGNPALTAVLRMPRGGANIARAAVSLPGSEFLAQDHLGSSCTRVQYAAGAGGGKECPKNTVYGRARAFSPLLDRPLAGKVYLRSNGGARELPDLVASLDGQIHVDLVGFIDTDKRTGGIRTTFARVPDAPVSKFVLKMPAGKKSLLENSTNICRGKHRAIVEMDGQNGRLRDFRPLVRAKCGKGARNP